MLKQKGLPFFVLHFLRMALCSTFSLSFCSPQLNSCQLSGFDKVQVRCFHKIQDFFFLQRKEPSDRFPFASFSIQRNPNFKCNYNSTDLPPPESPAEYMPELLPYMMLPNQRHNRCRVCLTGMLNRRGVLGHLKSGHGRKNHCDNAYSISPIDIQKWF